MYHIFACTHTHTMVHHIDSFVFHSQRPNNAMRMRTNNLRALTGRARAKDARSL